MTETVAWSEERGFRSITVTGVGSRRREIHQMSDSIICLAILVAVITADGLLGMCNRLLDPPPTIFRFIAPDLWRHSQETREPSRNDRLIL